MEYKELHVCDKMQAEYIEWIGMELMREYGLGLSAASINLFRNEVRTDWSLYSGHLGRFYLAFVEDDSRGMAGIKYASRSVCEFKRMYVSPRYRRLGLGRRLIERLLGDARISS